MLNIYRSGNESAESTTRRRVLRIAATVAATAPLALHPAAASPAAGSRRIRRAILVPRYGGDRSADWYPTALRELAARSISTRVVSLRPEPTAPGVDATVAAIADAVGTDPHVIAQTVLIGHSVGTRALLAYLSRRGVQQRFAGLVSVAGWFTVDALNSYPVLRPWVNMPLDFTSIAAAAGPINVHLSDNDPFTADWRDNAGEWLRRVGAAVHITHGAGHFMTTSPGAVLDTILVASQG